MAVLQHDHVYGSLNEFYSECLQRYPGRFLPLAQIREWEADQDEWDPDWEEGPPSQGPRDRRALEKTMCQAREVDFRRLNVSQNRLNIKLTVK